MVSAGAGVCATFTRVLLGGALVCVCVCFTFVVMSCYVSAAPSVPIPGKDYCSRGKNA